MENIIPGILGLQGYSLSGTSNQPYEYQDKPIALNEFSSTPNNYDAELPVIYGQSKNLDQYLEQEPFVVKQVIKEHTWEPKLNATFNIEAFNNDDYTSNLNFEKNNLFSGDLPYNNRTGRASKGLRTLEPLPFQEKEIVEGLQTSYSNRNRNKIHDFSSRIKVSQKDVQEQYLDFENHRNPTLTKVDEIMSRLPKLEHLRSSNKRTDINTTPNTIGKKEKNNIPLMFDKFKNKRNEIKELNDRAYDIPTKTLKERPNFNNKLNNSFDFSSFNSVNFSKYKNNSYRDSIYKNNKDGQVRVQPDIIKGRSIPSMNLFNSIENKETHRDGKQYNNSIVKSPIRYSHSPATNTELQNNFGGRVPQRDTKLIYTENGGYYSNYQPNEKDMGSISRKNRTATSIDVMFSKSNFNSNFKLEQGMDTKKKNRSYVNPYDPDYSNRGARNVRVLQNNIGEIS